LLGCFAEILCAADGPSFHHHHAAMKKKALASNFQEATQKEGQENGFFDISVAVFIYHLKLHAHVNKLMVNKEAVALKGSSFVLIHF